MPRFPRQIPVQSDRLRRREEYSFGNLPLEVDDAAVNGYEEHGSAKVVVQASRGGAGVSPGGSSVGRIDVVSLRGAGNNHRDEGFHVSRPHATSPPWRAFTGHAGGRSGSTIRPSSALRTVTEASSSEIQASPTSK